MIFHGTHRYPDALGRVLRLCLSLGVVPVLVPPRETGFQAMIESYNGWWQTKVWSRFQHQGMTALQAQSIRFVAAHRRHRSARIESAPCRRTFPERWVLNLQAHPRGRIVYIRRTDAVGKVELLGHCFEVDGQWLNRLVRVEVDPQRRGGGFDGSRCGSRPQPLQAGHAWFPNPKFHQRINWSCHGHWSYVTGHEHAGVFGRSRDLPTPGIAAFGMLRRCRATPIGARGSYGDARMTQLTPKRSVLCRLSRAAASRKTPPKATLCLWQSVPSTRSRTTPPGIR